MRRSKGLFNQSSRGTKDLVESSLSKILKVLKDVDSIKDVSTTSELIDGVVYSTKIYIDYIQNVFDLVDKFDDSNLFVIISENTTAAISAVSDCSDALTRLKSYIYNEIIGIVQLSD